MVHRSGLRSRLGRFRGAAAGVVVVPLALLVTSGGALADDTAPSVSTPLGTLVIGESPGGGVTAGDSGATDGVPATGIGLDLLGLGVEVAPEAGSDPSDAGPSDAGQGSAPVRAQGRPEAAGRR